MTTESKPLIFELLPRVMGDIGEIAKTQRNKQGAGYNFRGIDDALNHVSPALIKHGVTCSVKVHDVLREVGFRKTQNGEQRVVETTLLLDVTFTAPDGSSVTNTTAGEAIDYGGDKSMNKAMAAAMKYSLFFGLVIPVDRGSIDEGDNDPRDEGGEPMEKRPPARRQAKPPAGDGPGSDASAYTKASAAICSAMTVADVKKFLKMVATRAEEGAFSVDDVVELERLGKGRIIMLEGSAAK